MSKLLLAVRKTENLFNAWRKVRSNINASGNEEFRQKVKIIDLNPIQYIRSIQSRLQKGTFLFEKQRAVLKKGRPIVVAPIENRVVQRAMLNVLQSENELISAELGKLPDILSTVTSVGGVPTKGVHTGVRLVQEAIDSGAIFYLKSDIEKFFTTVPKSLIVSCIKQETGDAKFSNFFKVCLETELENEREVKDQIHLFPLDDTGVPQGSSLSALAGNIALKSFDESLNGRGITTIRYIDDFIMLGDSDAKLQSAFESGSVILNGMGMTAYDPKTNKEKAGCGKINDGFDFLGCRIKGRAVSVNKKSRQKFIGEIEQALKNASKTISRFSDNNDKRRAEDSLFQTLAALDRKIRGWGDAYNFTNNRLPMIQLDKKIERLVGEFLGFHFRSMKAVCEKRKSRMLGITLLNDIPHKKITSSDNKESI